MLGDCPNQITAKQDHGSHVATDYLLAGFDRVEALFLWRVDIEKFLQLFSRNLFRLFGDANRSLSLNVGMTAHRANSGAGATDVAPQQSEINQRLHRLDTLLVLGQTHPIDEHDGFCMGIHRSSSLKRAAGQPGTTLDRVPSVALTAACERLKPVGMFRDEIPIEDGTVRASRSCQDRTEPWRCPSSPRYRRRF